MRIKEHEMFPTLVVQIEDILTEQQRLAIFKYLMAKNDVLVEHEALDKGSLSSHNNSNFFVLEDIAKNVPSCGNLLSTIGEAIFNYAQQTGIKFSKGNNSWFNVQKVGSTLKAHCHPVSNISGALYINVDSDSSPLYFYNPNPMVEYAAVDNKRSTKYVNVWQKIRPMNSMLVLFPSWLKHGSGDEINKTENRMVISFNTI